MTKETKEPKPTNPDDWTDKQLATLRRDSVSLAIEAIKTEASAEKDALILATDFYNFIKDGMLPEPKAGGWK